MEAEDNKNRRQSPLWPHRSTGQRDERTTHGGCHGDQVVDDALVLGVGDVGDVEGLAHGVRQTPQAAAVLLGLEDQGSQLGPLKAAGGKGREGNQTQMHGVELT